MNSLCHRIVALAGLGLLSTACTAESPDDDLLDDSPAANPLDGPTGQGGFNGLPPHVFQPLASSLLSLLKKPLAINGQDNTDPAFSTFLGLTGGPQVFQYAIECALPVGTTAFGFTGEGLMATTGSWLGSPLTVQQASDVLTCITTRLNPSGVHVSLWLGGPDTAKGTLSSEYPYFEALWRVDLTDGIRYYVWPSDTFLLDTSCKTNISAIQQDLNTRICENNPANCHVTLRTDMATKCVGTPGAGDWMCDGKPAIETRLGATEWAEMHDKCFVGTDPFPKYKAVCGRNSSGIDCARTDGTTFQSSAIWQPAFSDVNGWNIGPQYYSTIRYADLNGDGETDMCGRGGGGINCALSTGTTFGNSAIWQGSFSDGNGWNGGPQYYSTIQFPDVNGDGKADVCGRGGGGIWCALSTGTSFGTQTLWQSFYSDAFGWNGAQYYSTIQFADINGDGKADVCGRGSSGMICATSTGSSFGSATLWQADYGDSSGWAVGAQYYSTIHLADLNGDGKADVCGRSASGILCALSTGSGFGTSALWQLSFSDANGGNAVQYYSSLQLFDINHDGYADLCERGPQGIACVRSVGTSFTLNSVAQPDYSDAAGWAAGPQYYTTIRLSSQ